MTQSYAIQRAEERVSRKVPAMLVGRHGKLGVEKAVTEDLSPTGARVISISEWYEDDIILFSLPAGKFTASVRVVYCHPLAGGRFRAGLEFIGENARLDVRAVAVESDVQMS